MIDKGRVRALDFDWRDSARRLWSLCAGHAREWRPQEPRTTGNITLGLGRSLPVNQEGGVHWSAFSSMPPRFRRFGAGSAGMSMS